MFSAYGSSINNAGFQNSVLDDHVGVVLTFFAQTLWMGDAGSCLKSIVQVFWNEQTENLFSCPKRLRFFDLRFWNRTFVACCENETADLLLGETSGFFG